MNSWRPYQPSPANPWDLKRVLHLHRRVVFGACWDEVQRDLSDGPQKAVERVLKGDCRIAGVPDDFESVAETIGTSAVDSGSPERLKAWWLYRCLFSPRPLEERLTLMWHNHFATSNLKVNDLVLMKQQNDTLRKHATSRFGELFHSMARDPAMLHWLDAPSNRAGLPNENFSRELMELFALGIGNYSEMDVKEGARALTGWTVHQGKFQAIEARHDHERKTILNRSGHWNGDDFLKILLEQKSCSRRIAWRLANEFFGEDVVSDQALDELAEGLRLHDLDIRWGAETILRSNLFFADDNIQSRIIDPVSFLLVPLRGLECWRSPPSTLVLAGWLRKMGQDLFYPPNVGGWSSGRQSLSSRTVIARANYAAAVASGQLENPSRLPQPPAGLEGIADRNKRMGCLRRLLCGEIRARSNQSTLRQPRKSTETGELLRHHVLGFLTSPDAQLH